MSHLSGSAMSSICYRPASGLVLLLRLTIAVCRVQSHYAYVSVVVARRILLGRPCLSISLCSGTKYVISRLVSMWRVASLWVGHVLICSRPASGLVWLLRLIIELSFPPDAVHTPGIAHVVADELSRIYAPKGSGIMSKSIHPALEHAIETAAPKRKEDWYRALQ